MQRSRRCARSHVFALHPASVLIAVIAVAFSACNCQHECKVGISEVSEDVDVALAGGNRWDGGEHRYLIRHDGTVDARLTQNETVAIGHAVHPGGAARVQQLVSDIRGCGVATIPSGCWDEPSGTVDGSAMELVVRDGSTLRHWGWWVDPPDELSKAVRVTRDFIAEMPELAGY